MPEVTCTSCGAENPAGQKFCGECGHALAAVCSSCGAANPPGQRFCGECGTALGVTVGSPTREPAAAAAERRLVSVLFADLVGFTTASEARDAEDTRELLSRYFETARTLVERYGGTVEKFIGDAVMAVWGTPVAQEDDAERAVRTALDLVAAIPALDPALQARAGVLTGEAAVTLGAGTLLLPFSTLLFAHVLSTFLGFAAFTFLWAERELRPALLQHRDRAHHLRS